MNKDEVRALFGYNLRRLRMKKSMSQLALAGQVNMAHNFINDLEHGKKWISPESLSRFSLALDAEIYEFFAPMTTERADFNLLREFAEELGNHMNQTIADMKARYSLE